MPTPAEIILSKVPLPTHLDSAEIRSRVAREIREKAFFSAQNAMGTYIKQLQQLLGAYAQGRLDASEVRIRARQKLADLGYVASGKGLADHASALRLNLILRTNTQMAAGMAQRESANDPLLAAAFPAWELVSGGYRKVHRTDWLRRWQAAGEAVGWQGARKGRRMVALKSSPIWEALGRGAGGFRDTLGNPYPPFAYGSSYEWSELSRAEARELGLLQQEVANSRPPFNKCPKCGKFAAFDGSCKSCGHTLSTDQMIQRGREALSRATQGNPKDVKGAMHKPGLGTIHFLQGWEGKGKEQANGKGLSKLQQKHRNELESLPETIAKGKVYHVKSEKTGEFDDRVRAIIYGSKIAFLSRHEGAWALTTHYTSETKAREIEADNR